MAETVEEVGGQEDLNGGGTAAPVEVFAALRRLDHLLAGAVAAADALYGPEAMADRFRGLHVTPEEVAGLLAREPGAPLLRPQSDEAEPPPAPDVDESSPLGWLAAQFGLSPFDMDVLLVALAPEIDLRYERLYAYLQDDVTRRRPCVDLALNLLCPAANEKLRAREHFSPEAPLVRHGLLQLYPDPHQLHPPLLSHYMKPDAQVVRLLLGRGGLDARLWPFCRLVEPSVYLDQLPLAEELKRALPALVLRATEEGRPLRLCFHGPRGVGKRRATEALAGEVRAPLLVADLARAPFAHADFEQALQLLFREAWFQGAILYLENLDALRGDERATQYRWLTETLAEDHGVTIVGSAHPLGAGGEGSVGALNVPFGVLDFDESRSCWQSHLELAQIEFAGDDLDALADRFRLTPGQIAESVAVARIQSDWRAAAQSNGRANGRPPRPPGLAELSAAARLQSGHELAALAKKIEPVYTWDDIVLPEDALTQLGEICRRVTHRRRVLGEWGFDRKLSAGKGINALFAGSSGTGKTMAAEIIANELRLDLYKIDLSGVVSKYIGETEKNLDRVFRAATNANAILFFDEADALFGKRSEVRDSHDRYANIEISYLLQKMEEYEGIAILATNLRQNLDESFVRRLAFTIHFPFPDEADRQRIWSGIWPAETPLAADLDLDFLARRFKLSGGNIKNIALAAAFYAAEDGGAVAMRHMLRATRREYQKLGKPLSAAELGPFTAEVA